MRVLWAFTSFFISIFCKLINCPILQLRLSRMLSFLLYQKSISGFPIFNRVFCWKLFFYSYCMLTPIRNSILAIMQYRHENIEDHVWIDPVHSHFVLQFNFFNYYTTAATGLLGLYALFIDYTIFYQFDLYLINRTYEIIVRNSTLFWVLNSGSNLKFSSRKQIKDFCVHLWNGVNVCFYHPNLKCYPNIGHKIRTQALVLSTILDWGFAGFLIFLGKLIQNNIISKIFYFYILVLNFGFLSYSFLLILYPIIPVHSFIFALFDIILIVYAAWNTIRMCLFGIHLIFIPSFVYQRQIQRNNASLVALLVSRQSEAALVRYLAVFKSQYVSIHYTVQYIDQNVSSPIMLATLLTNVLISAFNFNLLLHIRLLPGEVILLAIILTMQVGLSLVICRIFIRTTDALHSSGGILYQTQPQLGRKVIHSKLKLMLFHEVECTNNRFYFTAGPIGPISRQSMLEVISY